MTSRPPQAHAFVVYSFGPCPDGKFYIGQTSNLEKRWRQHRKADGRCPAFHAAIKRFGIENIPFRVLAETDAAEEADRIECLYIVKNNALFPHGYNLTLGGKSRRFEPGQKVEGFTEDPVPNSDLIEFATHIAYETETAQFKGTEHLACACPCCGGENYGGMVLCRCGVDRDYSKHYIKGIAEGKAFEEIQPPTDTKLLKSWRSSTDSEFFIYLLKRRSRGVKIADILPTAAHRYAISFWPYLLHSLQSRILRERGRPLFHVGRFIPYKGSKDEATAAVETEYFLRSRRRELGDFEANVAVLSDYFRRFKTKSGPYWTSALATIRASGGSDAEIVEAINRIQLVILTDQLNAHGGIESFYIAILRTTRLAVMIQRDVYEVEFDTKHLLENFIRLLDQQPPQERKSAVNELVTIPSIGRSVSLRLRPSGTR